MLENIINRLINKVKRISSTLILTAAIGTSSLLLPNFSVDYNNIARPTISYSTTEAASKTLRIKKVKDEDLSPNMIYDKYKSREEKVPVYIYKLPTFKQEDFEYLKTTKKVPKSKFKEILKNNAGSYMYMVHVPTGPYWDMKGPKPVPVNVDDFFIGMYEVTNEQFKKFIDETEYKVHEPNLEYPKEANKIAAKSRVRYAFDFVKWINSQLSEKEIKEGKVKLPTEKQWEKAARGIDQRIYPWGNDLPSIHQVGKIPKNNKEIESYVFHEVGIFKAGRSPFGLYDMGGNAIEICRDKIGEKYIMKGNAIYAISRPSIISLRSSVGFDGGCKYLSFRCVFDDQIK